MKTLRAILKKSTAAKVLGLFAVALCFTLVLSLLLTTGGVANAYNRAGLKTSEGVIGTIGKSFDGSGLNADLFTFSGSENNYEWTYTEDFATGKAGSTNHQIYTPLRANDDDHLIQYINDDQDEKYDAYDFSDENEEAIDSNFVFSFGVYAGGESAAFGMGDNADKNWYSMVTHYQIGDFLKGLIGNESNSKFTVKVGASAEISANDSTQEIFFGIQLTNHTYSGYNAWDEMHEQNCGDKKDHGFLKNSNGKSQAFDAYDKDFELMSDTQYIAIMAGTWFKYRPNKSEYLRTITISKLALHFTVTYNGTEDITTQAPTLSDAVKNEDYTVSERNWLNSYTFSPTLTFENEVLDVFSQGFNLYVAVKSFNSDNAFKNFEDNGIDNNDGYKSITAENYGDYDIDVLYTPNFGSGSAPMELDLLSSNGVGLRLIYVWVVDPAGTASDINSYYVLVDATDYDVSASIGNAAAGSVSVTSGATVKRGQDITVTVTLNEGYVPYRFKNGDDVLLSNDTADKDFEVVSAYDDLISVEKSGNVYTVTYTVKDDSTLGQIDTSFDFTVSARKVVTATVAASYSHPYDNNAPATGNYLSGVDDSTALSLFTFTYYTSGDTLFGEDGKTAPVDAGSYSVAVSFPTDNDDYVLGSSLTNRVALTIDPKTVTVTPTATNTVYGAAINNLKYTTSNFSPLNGETLDVALKLDTESWGGIVGVGSYNIVFDGTPTVKKNGTASGNYTVVLSATPIKHTVTKKYVTVTPIASESVYGERINLDCTHDFAAVDGETIEVVLKLKNANLNGTVEANSYEIVLDEATVVKKGETVSKNYAVVLSPTPVKHTVTKKAVTVTPNASNSTFGNSFTLGYTDDFTAVNGETLVGTLKLENEQKTGNYTTVGEYGIIQDTQFAVLTSAGQPSGNYTVTFNAGAKHTVGKRAVQLTVNSTSAIKHGETPNPDNTVPKYTLANEDKPFETLVKNAVSGKFVLTASGNGTEGINTEIYSEYYEYTVTLDEITDQNLTVTLAPNAKHTIYIGVPGRVHEVETETGDATVTVENGTTANKLVVEEIDENGSAENELWNTVNAGVPEIDENAELISIVTIGLYLDDEPITVDGVLTVNIAIPEVAGDLENLAIYVLNANGELELLEDCTVDEGRLEYTTDYLGSIVFLNIKEEVSVDPTPGPDDPNPNPNPDPNPNPGPDDPTPNPNPNPNPGPDDPNPDDPNPDDPDPTPNPDPSDDGNDQPKGGMPAWQIALIAVIAGLVVIGGAVTAVILVRKKSKQKKS